MRAVALLIVALGLAANPALAGFDDTGPQILRPAERRQRDGPDGRYPGWLIKLADPVAEPFGRAVAHVVWRKGRIGGETDAMALLARSVRPLDVVLTKSRGRLTGRLIPGLFTHAVVYLGSESELRALGLWNAPVVRPHQAAIRAGKVWIESVSRRVRLSGVKKAIDADQLAVLRAPLGATAKRKAARTLFAHLGVPYDYRLDADESDALFCAELVDHVLPVNLPHREMYGRSTIVPTDVATAALAGKGGLRFVLYLKSGRDGWSAGDKAMLKRDIGQGW